eukprot:gene4015-2869_t
MVSPTNCVLAVKIVIMGYAGDFHYEEVKLEDMIVAEEKNRLLYPCPCGDLFELFLDDFRKGGDVATCPTCSLTIRRTLRTDFCSRWCLDYVRSSLREKYYLIINSMLTCVLFTAAKNIHNDKNEPTTTTGEKTSPYVFFPTVRLTGFFLSSLFFVDPLYSFSRMYRRVFSSISRATGAAAATMALRFLSLDKSKREDLTKHLVALKEECKGQGLDLADMNDAAKDAGRAVQDKVKQLAIDDAQFKGKVLTLSASVKAYHTRLANLQTEAQSIQGEVDALLKLMWGTESPEAASFASPPPASKPSEKEMAGSDDGFTVEPPPIAKMVDDINKSAETKKVEQVDGEHLPSDVPSPKGTSSAKEEEIEVETIEIEVEPETSSTADPAEEAVDKMKITDITSDLYERGINFSDCLDAKSLRQRYKDVLKGLLRPRIHSSPPMPKRADAAQHYQQQQQYTPPPPNTSQAGLAHDPYPNAKRKMVDPMRLVDDVKRELCSEQGVDPSTVDLWSGKVLLEGHKRLYDYPTVQSYPIEVRQKGDFPR